MDDRAPAIVGVGRVVGGEGAGEPDADAPWPDLALGDDLAQWIGHPHPHPLALAIAEPIQMYPLMEAALGAALGRRRDERVSAISRLWARMSEVAACNPFEPDRRGYTADEIARADPSNRDVGFSYTKSMSSNRFVDQAAAILLCSVGVARAIGIASERWVLPWAGVGAHEAFVSERWHLHESRATSRRCSPRIRSAGRSGSTPGARDWSSRAARHRPLGSVAIVCRSSAAASRSPVADAAAAARVRRRLRPGRAVRQAVREGVARLPPPPPPRGSSRTRQSIGEGLVGAREGGLEVRRPLEASHGRTR